MTVSSGHINSSLAIVGRPNVGKSSIFNRLIKKNKALVHDFAGVTRDRNEAIASWTTDSGTPLRIGVVDTGGLIEKNEEQVFTALITEQVKEAVSRASIILFVFDGKEGFTPADNEVLNQIRPSISESATLLGVVNKLDNPEQDSKVGDFFDGGIYEVYGVSAAHDRGFAELRERIAKHVASLPPVSRLAQEVGLEDLSQVTANLAIFGKPNVGKSTLLNALASENRAITSPVAGTTIDPIDKVVRMGDKKYLLIDTAGIRKKSKTKQGVEVLSIVQAKETLEKSDLVLLMISAEEGPTDQDEKIGGLIQEAGCSTIIVLNKWDQLHSSDYSREQAADHIRKKMPFLSYAPIIFISAKYKQGLKQIPDLADETLELRAQNIPTNEFTKILRQEVNVHNPKNARVFYAHQSSRQPPSFVAHVNNAKRINFSVKRHLINSIRKRWNYMGSPVRLSFRSRSS